MSKPLAERENSAVYVIGHDDGPQKIGFSYFPTGRAGQLSKPGESRLKVHGVAIVATSDAREVERLAHWHLREKALGGELFDVSPDEATAAITEAAHRFYEEGERAPEPGDAERLNVVATKALVRRLNEWRARNGFVGKSEAVRILVERALNAEDAERTRKPKDT